MKKLIIFTFFVLIMFSNFAFVNPAPCVGKSESGRQPQTGASCWCNGQFVYSQDCIWGTGDCSKIRCDFS